MTSMDGRGGSRADELLADWADLAGRARRPTEAPIESRPSGLGMITRLVGPMVFGITAVLAIGVLMPREPGDRLRGGAGMASASSSPAPTHDGCLVTRPNDAHTSAWPASELDHGEGGLFTVLWPDGTVLVPVSEIDRDGIGWMKFVFQREGAAEGGLRLAGRRIGAEASDPRGVLRSQIPDGYGTNGVQATAIGFPGEGCWEVTARSGSAQLRFVTRVELAGAEAADLLDGPAPSVVLERPDGTTATAVPASGRPTIFTFWSSWCPACVDEPAMLEESSRPDVDTVLVAVKDDPVAVAQALGGRDLSVLLDEPGDAFARYGGFGLPLTVFIDADGVIRSVVHGPLDATSMAAGLDAIRPLAWFVSEPSGSPIAVDPMREPTPAP